MKTVKLQNYNNKLQCDFIVHIAEAPKDGFKDSALPIPVMLEEIKTGGTSSLDMIGATNVQPPIRFEAEMINFIRLDIYNLPSVLVMLSHGIDTDSFIKQHKGEPTLAAYIYKRKK